MDGQGHPIDWLGTVNTHDGLNWLEVQAQNQSNRANAHHAMQALGLHASPESGQRLHQLALEQNGRLAQDAIFWLGEARGSAGLDALTQLLEQLPIGDSRREINFALAQNNSDDAAEKLFWLGQHDADKKQRSDALFWLAQAYPARAEPVLLELIETETNKQVLHEIVFAISQLPDARATTLLLDLASGQYQRDVRRQALFWLAQSDDENALEGLTQLLSL